MRAFTITIAAIALLASRPARADRGALTAEVSSGIVVESVRLPPSLGSASQVGTGVSLSLAANYSLTNSLVFSGLVFWEPSTTWVHEGASSGEFRGSLTSNSFRFGALAGVHAVRGSVWQFSAGLSGGFSERMFSHLNLYDVSGTAPRSYGLQLADFSTASLVVAPSLGVRWTGDHVAVGLEPRVELLFGPGMSWAVVVPLTVSWSWYP
jgi:hypothetical protein